MWLGYQAGKNFPGITLIKKRETLVDITGNVNRIKVPILYVQKSYFCKKPKWYDRLIVAYCQKKGKISFNTPKETCL